MPRTRESQRETSRARYADYGRMCAELGVKHAGPNWCSHYAELRRMHGEYVRRPPDDTAVRLTWSQLLDYWRSGYTEAEIQELASGW